MISNAVEKICSHLNMTFSNALRTCKRDTDVNRHEKRLTPHIACTGDILYVTNNSFCQLEVKASLTRYLIKQKGFMPILVFGFGFMARMFAETAWLIFIPEESPRYIYCQSYGCDGTYPTRSINPENVVTWPSRTFEPTVSWDPKRNKNIPIDMVTATRYSYLCKEKETSKIKLVLIIRMCFPKYLVCFSRYHTAHCHSRNQFWSLRQNLQFKAYGINLKWSKVFCNNVLRFRK